MVSIPVTRSVDSELQLPKLDAPQYISKLLKPEYSVFENVEVEGIFEDMAEKNSMILLAITNNHLIIASITDNSMEPSALNLGSMTSLSLISITIADATERILRIIYCTGKDKMFRMCEMEQHLDHIWLDFVCVIQDKHLDHEIITVCKQYHFNDDDISQDVNISILTNYAGFPADQHLHGDQPKTLSWWQDAGLHQTNKEHEYVQYSPLAEDNNQEGNNVITEINTKHDHTSVSDLLDYVQRDIINSFAVDKTRDDVTGSSSGESNWSTSSAVVTDSKEQASVNVVMPTKRRSFKKVLVPTFLRRKRNPKRKGLHLLACCTSKCEQD